jgi:Arc-like DNA binding domain
MKKPSEIVQLKLRFTERLRRRLEKAADESEDSMNAEIIRRLEISFEKQDAAIEALEMIYGGTITGLMLAIGDIMKDTSEVVRTLTAGKARGEGWVDDAPSFDQVVKGVTTFIEGLRPAGDTTVREWYRGLMLPDSPSDALRMHEQLVRIGKTGSNIGKEKLALIAKDTAPTVKREEIQQRLLATLSSRAKKGFVK